MIRIGDFARLSDVSVATLRHYDEIGLLKPISVDSARQSTVVTLRSPEGLDHRVRYPFRQNRPKGASDG